MVASKKDEEPKKPRRAPAKTPQVRENQMIALTVDLAEQQLLAGTASQAVIVHYLKLATIREKKERTKLDEEISLLRTKREAIESGKVQEEIYAKALDAMRSYQGQDVEFPDED